MAASEMAAAAMAAPDVSSTTMEILAGAGVVGWLGDWLVAGGCTGAGVCVWARSSGDCISAIESSAPRIAFDFEGFIDCMVRCLQQSAAEGLQQF